MRCWREFGFSGNYSAFADDRAVNVMSSISRWVKGNLKNLGLKKKKNLNEDPQNSEEP